MSEAVPVVSEPEPFPSPGTPTGSRLSADEIATLLAVLSPSSQRAAPTPTSEAVATISARPPVAPPAGPATGAAQTPPAKTPEATPTTPRPPAPRLAVAEIAALVARGDAFFDIGDITSARLFYERAADAGDGQAALKLGKSFDPGSLAFGRSHGVRGDPGMAASWYRRARAGCGGGRDPSHED